MYAAVAPNRFAALCEINIRRATATHCLGPRRMYRRRDEDSSNAAPHGQPQRVVISFTSFPSMDA